MSVISDETRRQLAAELLPHLARIMRLSRPAHGTVESWMQTAIALRITLKDLIDEIKRQEARQ